LREEYKLQKPKTKVPGEVDGLTAAEIGLTGKMRLLHNERFCH
jgi:hypothetical protein